MLLKQEEVLRRQVQHPDTPAQAPQHLNARDVVHPCPHPGPCCPAAYSLQEAQLDFRSGLPRTSEPRVRNRLLGKP